MAHRDTSFSKPGHRRTGCLWLVLDDQGRTLLVQPSYKGAGTHQLVGGGAVAKEAPHLAGTREGWEEIGLRMVPDTLLITDYVPHNENTGTAEGLNLVFLHRLLPGEEITLNAGGTPEGEDPELVDFKWLTADELDEHCEPYQARRIRAAMEAAADPAKRGYRFEGQLIAHSAA